MQEIERFIVRAKANSYVGSGRFLSPCRRDAHDVGFEEGDWAYLDSYFGGTDFVGQEVVWKAGIALWAMNYHGRILRPDLIDAAIAGRIIKAALSALYREGRFLGGFDFQAPEGRYVDRSEGGFDAFTGTECIFVGDDEAYRLVYHGGLVKP